MMINIHVFVQGNVLFFIDIFLLILLLIIIKLMLGMQVLKINLKNTLININHNAICFVEK